MHRLFQNFIDLLFAAESPSDFCSTIKIISAEFDLSCFAYLSLADTPEGKPRLISTYPETWTSHYLLNEYQHIDPVIQKAARHPEPFRWGLDLADREISTQARELLAEALDFGIRFGFTIPIQIGPRPVAALTFATNEKRASFDHCIQSNERVLQLMAMCFHAHVRRKLSVGGTFDRVPLSRRELECLKWAAQGKSAWEIGQILRISRNTAADYLNNAKEKLGVRTVIQAATLLAAANKQKQN
ncbi:DNA-binding transcriptional regulator, CsgD family [Bradyrhizobium sp. Ghvi]|nr:DNA-binding transcriptional regulator, CsgD family [Bradyrhizobium sp. Ghvi]